MLIRNAQRVRSLLWSELLEKACFDFLIHVIEGQDFALSDRSESTSFSCKICVGNTEVETEVAVASESGAGSGLLSPVILVWDESFCLVSSQSDITIQV